MSKFDRGQIVAFKSKMIEVDDRNSENSPFLCTFLKTLPNFAEARNICCIYEQKNVEEEGAAIVSLLC